MSAPSSLARARSRGFDLVLVADRAGVRGVVGVPLDQQAGHAVAGEEQGRGQAAHSTAHDQDRDFHADSFRCDCISY